MKNNLLLIIYQKLIILVLILCKLPEKREKLEIVCLHLITNLNVTTMTNFKKKL